MNTNKAKKPSQDFRVIAYLRISNGLSQCLENQKLGVLEYCNKKHWKAELIEEKISGRVSYKDRELGNVIKTLKKNDVLLVSELSRLGRSMLEIVSLLSDLSERGIRVYAVKGDYTLDNTIQSKIMTMIFSLVSELERDLLSQRTKEALARKKKEGVILGRPKGVAGKSRLDDKREDIKKLLDKDVSIASMAKIYDCSWTTMKNFIQKKVVNTASPVVTSS